MPKDVEEVKIDVKKQINVIKADTQLCENININDEDFSMLDTTMAGMFKKAYASS